jgi:hypothetical protein
MNAVVQLRPSQSEKPTVRGGRSKNTDYRQREYLTEAEIAKLVATAGDSRNPGARYADHMASLKKQADDMAKQEKK